MKSWRAWLVEGLKAFVAGLGSMNSERKGDYEWSVAGGASKAFVAGGGERSTPLCWKVFGLEPGKATHSQLLY